MTATCRIHVVCIDLPAGRGAGWFREGLALFGRDWLIWIVNTILLLVILIVLGMIPLVSILTNILAPIFTGGLMLGCRSLDEGGRLEVGHLFAGFTHNSGRLAAVGGLYLLGTILVMIAAALVVLALGVDFGTMMTEPEAMTPEQGSSLLVGALVMLALFVPLLMAYWFAPALVVLHDLGAMQAMKLSFRGCLKNILPFLIYGLVGLLLAVLATIPFGLGWLALVPVMTASIYVGYKDIYLGRP